MSHLVMAVFHDRDEALAAVDALVREGVAPMAIGFLAGWPERFGQLHNNGVVSATYLPSAMRAGKAPVEDADPLDTNAPTPGFGLRHLTQFSVPDLGEVLAAGPFVEALRASPSWPGERAIIDALVRRGIDSSAAQVAMEELRHGGIVLTVHDADRHRADLILRRYHPLDLTP